MRRIFAASGADGDGAIITRDDIDGPIFHESADNAVGQRLQRFRHPHAHNIAVDRAQLQRMLSIEPARDFCSP